MLTCRRRCHLHLHLRCELPVGVVSYQLTLRARPLLHISCGCGCALAALKLPWPPHTRGAAVAGRGICGAVAVAACNCNCNCYSSLAELIAREKVFRGLDFVPLFSGLPPPLTQRGAHQFPINAEKCANPSVKGHNRRGSMSVLGMLEATLPLSPCLDLHTSVGGCHGTGFRGLHLVS